MRTTIRTNQVLLCVVLLLSAFLAVSLLLSCSRSTSGTSSKEAIVRLAVNPVPQGALVILASENNYFKDEGLKVQISKFTTGKLAFDAVLGGAADLATVADIPIMYAAMSGQSPAVIATIERSGKSVKLLARGDRGVHNPQDLIGKKIGTFKASSAEFFLSKFLGKNQIPLERVTIVHLQPTDLVPAIVRGDLDAISIWEPNIFNAQKQIGPSSVTFVDPDVYTETFNITCTENYLRTNRSKVAAFLRALQRAEIFLKNSPDEALTKVASFTGLDPQVLKQIWPAFDLSLNVEPSLPALLRRQAEFAVASGTLGNLEDIRIFPHTFIQTSSNPSKSISSDNYDY